MIKDVKKVCVKYNGRIVGYLVEIEPQKIGFQYDDEWIKDGFSVSPLSLPLSKEVYVSEKSYFQGLYGVFWDSLPDGWGELLLNRCLQKQGVNPDRISALTKLSLINKNGLGGLTYEPARALFTAEEECDFDKLACEAERVLKEEASSKDFDDLYYVGGASGGARPKAHVKIDGEEWIVKFGCRIDPVDVGIKEFVANETAKKCGIATNEYRLFPSKRCGGYFGVKRFDRDGEKRIHMVSLSALLETTHRIPNLDYTHLFQVITAICVRPVEDAYEAFRRMCFNVFYKNKDDHGKNFAFLYDEEAGGYVLSPAYDITSVPDRFEHEMTVNGNGNPQKSDILALAKKFGLSAAKCKEIIKITEETIFSR